MTKKEKVIFWVDVLFWIMIFLYIVVPNSLDAWLK